MNFVRLDGAAVTRALSQIADQPGDLADVFLERREVLELPPPDDPPGLRAWRESGLAVRLLRGGRSWLSGHDEISRRSFRDAIRRVARAMPRAPYPDPDLVAEPWTEPISAPELLEFPSAIRRALRGHRGGPEPALTIRRHRRWVRVIGTQVASGVESESFYSLRAEAAWGRFGILLPGLDAAAAEQVALSLARAERAHRATPPEGGRKVCVLGPAATAVLLHEAVAHALEADTLALTGHPENAIGVRLGSAELNVFENSASAPAGVRRTADDEGYPVARRCLLRAGVVEQPICDAVWSRRSEWLSAGAGRRADRHHPPGPRSYHLELAAGELTTEELLADAEGGVFLAEAERGHLDPLTGVFTLRFPWGRSIHRHAAGEPVGACALRGQIAELLDKVTGVGREARAAGAGWCAKDGVRLPVWATAPELRLEDVDLVA